MLTAFNLTVLVQSRPASRCSMPAGFTVCHVWSDPSLLPAQDLY